MKGFIRVTDAYGEQVIVATSDIRLVQKAVGPLNHGWHSCCISRHSSSWDLYVRESHHKVWDLLEKASGE
jgi:hypothetical protein